MIDAISNVVFAVVFPPAIFFALRWLLPDELKKGKITAGLWTAIWVALVFVSLYMAVHYSIGWLELIEAIRNPADLGQSV
jgi:predicted permease